MHNARPSSASLQPIGKTAYTVRLDGQAGPHIVLHPRSTEPPRQEGFSIPIPRPAMACIVRQWRAIGMPRHQRGINAAHTALMAMARLGKIQITALP
jgi:hypothetical protein